MASEIYRKLPSVKIPSVTYIDLKGTEAEIARSPFKYGHIEQFSQVVVNDVSPTPDEITLRRITRYHLRSFEMRFGQNSRILWADEFGNVFTSLTLKGNNLEDPGCYKSSTAPGGILVYGLQDSDAMIRVLRASQLLRSANVDTEAIVKIMEPEELPFDGQADTIGEFKKQMVKKVWDQDAKENELDPEKHFYRLTRQDIPHLSQVLDGRTFFITARAMKVSERLKDFGQARSKLEFYYLLANVFETINQTEKLQSQTPEHFDINNSNDVQRYFLRYLPQKIALNLARMHNLGLIHWFPHTGNITASGGFCDLDTVKGEPLGISDEKVTEELFQRDVNYLLVGDKESSNGIYELIGPLNELGIIENEYEAVEKFNADFARAYVAERGLNQNLMDNIEYIYACFGKFDGNTLGEDLRFYAELLKHQLEWEGKFISPQEALEKFKEENGKFLLDASKLLILGNSVEVLFMESASGFIYEAPNPDFDRFVERIGEEYGPKKSQIVKDIILGAEIRKYDEFFLQKEWFEYKKSLHKSRYSEAELPQSAVKICGALESEPPKTALVINETIVTSNNSISFEDLISAISKLGGSIRLDGVRVSEKDSMNILVGSHNPNKPLVLFSDGIVQQGESRKLDVFGATYVAWIAKNEQGEDTFHIQSILKTKDLKKLIKNNSINISISVKNWK